MQLVPNFMGRFTLVGSCDTDLAALQLGRKKLHRRQAMCFIFISSARNVFERVDIKKQ